MMDASDIHPQRIKAKEVLISQKDEEFVFPIEDGTAKLSRRDYEFGTPRPYYVWPEALTKIGKAAQNREKQEMGKRETKA